MEGMEERTPAEVLAMVEDEGVEFVDLRFCDLPGVMQHVTIPAGVLDEGQFEEGHAFDGSSVRGFQSIHESDMMLLPDPETAQIDPFREAKTLNLNFFVHDPFTREAYSRGVLHLRLGLVRLTDERHLLRDRLRVGLVEHR